MKTFICKWLLSVGVIFSFTQFLSCSTVQQLANVQKPTVGIQQVRITGLSLDSIDLAFDLNVHNPNPLAVTMAGFDYDVQVNNSSVVKGNQRKAASIEAADTSRIELPVTLGFQDLYNAYTGLRNADSTGYTLLAGLTLDLPVMGETRIPIQTSGKIPIVKVPTLSVGSLKVNNIGIGGASLDLSINVSNPNAFSFLVHSLSYNLSVEGKTWAKGVNDKEIPIRSKGESMVIIPMTLNFIDLGSSVYTMLSSSSGQKIPYRLTGDLNLSSPGVPLMGRVNLPIDRSGEINLSK